MNSRKIILLIFVFQLFYSLANAQIKLIGNITTNGIAEYPTHIDSLSKGGYMSMPTIALRDAIPTLRRKYGMLVFVEADGVIYKLNAATLANGDWIALSFGATTGVDAGTLSGTTLKSTITGSSLTSVGNLIAGSIPISLLTGTVPTWNQNTTGNAATATLATNAITAENITATTNTTLTSLSNLATVGTITSGVWSGTAVAIENGGTGATTASAARTNLGLVIGTNVMAANAITTLTGDVTGTGTGTFTSTLANSGVSASSYGSSTSIPTFTVDAKGRLTTASTASIVADAGTLTGTSLNATITGSSLTGVGTITSGTWSGTAVAIAKGGTGLTATGTDGQILTSTNTGTLTWTTAAAAKFTNDVTIKLSGSKSLGKYANGSTIPTAGKTLDQFLLDLVQETVAPTYTAPTVSISSDKSASYEIGTNIGTVTLSKSFTQNNGGAEGVTTYSKNSVSLGTAVSTDIHGVLSTSISYSVTVTYGAGTVQNNNLGAPDATGQIQAGSAISSSLTISPFANKYWGTSSSTSINSATLTLTTTSKEAATSRAKSSFNIPISVADQYIFYAYPATFPASLGALSSISIEGFGSLEAFTLTTQNLTNASGHTQSYYIYISNNTFSSDINNIIIN